MLYLVKAGRENTHPDLKGRPERGILCLWKTDSFSPSRYTGQRTKRGRLHVYGVSQKKVIQNNEADNADILIFYPSTRVN